MSSTHADFTGTPFVAGSILGERCFDIDDDGRLKSPMKPFHWGHDTNESTCMKSDTTLAGKFHNSRWLRKAVETAKQFIPDGMRVDTVQPVGGFAYGFASVGQLSFQINYWNLSGERGHVIVTRAMFENAMWEQHGHNFKRCSCGFYAYLNGYNEYAASWRVTGVIEGFGECFIGRRGFRCQRANLLAITLPEQGWLNRGVLDQMTRRYPNLPTFDSVREMKREFPPTNVAEVLSLAEESEDE